MVAERGGEESVTEGVEVEEEEVFGTAGVVAKVAVEVDVVESGVVRENVTIRETNVCLLVVASAIRGAASGDRGGGRGGVRG